MHQSSLRERKKVRWYEVTRKKNRKTMQMSTEVIHGNKRGKCELFCLCLGKKKSNALAALHTFFFFSFLLHPKLLFTPLDRNTRGYHHCTALAGAGAKECT